MKKDILKVLITLIIGFVYYYLMLPPINIQSAAFWSFLVFILITYIIINTATSFDIRRYINRKVIRNESIHSIVLVYIVVGIIVLPFILNFFLSPVFNAKGYAKRIMIDETTSFKDDVKEVNFDALPILDKASSQKIGDRVMGQMSELVSQFDVSSLYTQINYNSEIVRVTPLEYSDFFKFLSNNKKGVQGYIKVNSVSGESKLIKLKDGMKYMDSAYLSKDLNRHLRFNYPTIIFGDKSFEIDNEGNPYWIVPTEKYVGIGLKRETSGVVILDPITGDSKYYDVKDVPAWVDHVYNADLIIEQVNDWGRYRRGFINSIFGQKDVVATTEGYNYTVMNDDVYLYTGITSAVADESNIGFILTNMRTKETHFYSSPGAEEYSAMASAEGQVQQMNYNASFPLLINLNNRPTYFMSLKDYAGLVKMYSFVDVEDYQKVVVTESSKGIKEAAMNYLNNSNIDVDESSLTTKTITVNSISMAIINGSSKYYIIDETSKKYVVDITVKEDLIPFIKNGDRIEIKYTKEDKITEIKSIKSAE